MKILNIILFSSLLTFCISCSTTKVKNSCSDKWDNATLYYLKECKEIKGYVNIKKNGLQKVFQHELPKQFQQDSIQVCIKYIEVGVGILMSDCLQSDIIEIKSIALR